MIVLDTNVISALIQATPDATAVAWVNSQTSSAIWTTAITVFEIQFGLAAMPIGQRRQNLQDSFDTALGQMGQRVLELDADAAREAAFISARLRAIGRPIEFRDAMIAGTVAARRYTLATRNTKHFADAGIPLIDLWIAGLPKP
jgi:predicted nucleic acid-binding protein